MTSAARACSAARAAASRSAKESSGRAEYGPKGVRPTAHSRLGSVALRAALHAASDGATPQPLCSSAPSTAREASAVSSCCAAPPHCASSRAWPARDCTPSTMSSNATAWVVVALMVAVVAVVAVVVVVAVAVAVVGQQRCDMVCRRCEASRDAHAVHG